MPEPSDPTAPAELSEDERPAVGPHRDSPDEAPWAMQLVMRIEKADPPSRTALCRAAALACVRLLDDERARDGEWQPFVQRWLDGRIRKHARRARGAAWERVQLLDGVTAAVPGGEVRAFVPCSTAEIPKDVAKLQLSGSEPEDPDLATALDPTPGGPLVVAITPEPFLPLGKAVAAAAHAAQISTWEMPEERLAVWREAGFPVVVEHPDVPRWRALRRVAQVEVLDGGFTVVTPGTCTAVARWA
ncbi:MAG: peptidyl-tRNA hydrolase [Kineosporiaceae bacterium]